MQIGVQESHPLILILTSNYLHRSSSKLRLHQLLSKRFVFVHQNRIFSSRNPSHCFKMSDQFTQHSSLTFRTSDDKIINLDWEVIIKVGVLKNMLIVGNRVDSNPIPLYDTEERLSIFFKVLEFYGKVPNTPKELSDLRIGQLADLLELADQYDALLVGLFVQQEVMKKVIDVNLYDERVTPDLTPEEILSLFCFADKLNLKPLVEISAKLTLRIDNMTIVKAIPDRLDGLLTRREHILPLIRFSERWETIRKKIIKEPLYDEQTYHEMHEYYWPEWGTPEDHWPTLPAFTSKSFLIYDDKSSEAKTAVLIRAFEDLKFEERYRPKGVREMEEQS